MSAPRGLRVSLADRPTEHASEEGFPRQNYDGTEFVRPTEWNVNGDQRLGGFLNDLGAWAGAAAVVVGVFSGLGYVNRTDVLGLSPFLGTRSVFFGVAFLLIGVVGPGWIAFQQHGR